MFHMLSSTLPTLTLLSYLKHHIVELRWDHEYLTINVVSSSPATASVFVSLGQILKGCRIGRSDKVSLWYVALLINTRFRFFI